MKVAEPPIARAIEIMGGPTKAAQALEIDNPSVVLNWRTRGRAPAERVLDIERLTGISRHVLRPDIFGKKPEHVAS